MRSDGNMKLNRLPLILLAAAFAVPALAQSADKDKLAEVDRNFVCPENLPTDAARQEAVKQYLLSVGDAWPGVTVNQMIAFRVALLNKHNCTKTLEALKRQNQ